MLLLERLKERGVRVPEDVSVVSFDNYYPQVQDGVKLCTYENDEKVIARISVSTLLKRIEGKKQAGRCKNRGRQDRARKYSEIQGGLLIWQK